MLFNGKKLLNDTSLYKQLFEQSSDAMLLIKDNHFIACNKASQQMLGWVNTDNIFPISPADISPKTQPCGMRSTEKSKSIIEKAYDNEEHKFDWWHINANKEVFPVEVKLTAIYHNNERFLHVLWRSIPTHYNQYKKLKVAESVQHNTTDAIMITDHKNIIIDVNPAFCKITGYTKKEAIGQNSGFMKSGIQGKSFYQQMWRSINDKGFWRGNIWDKKKSGDYYSKTLSISVIKNENNEIVNFIGLFSDSTALLEYEDTIQKQANFDSLTGFPNRSFLLNLLEDKILTATSENSTFSLAFIDIDNFKIINDTKGHAFGDQIIIKIIQCVRNCIDDKDILGRMSGDEFLIIFDTNQTLTMIKNKIQRIITLSDFAIEIDSNDFFVTLSAGISSFPSDGMDVSTLIANADIAMYHVKQNGGTDYALYNDRLGKTFQENNELEEEFISAINERKIIPYFQAKLDLSSGHIVGCESLARWQRSSGEYVSPEIFIEIAEKKYRINQLSSHLFLTTFKSIASMQLPSNFIISVNVSPMVLLDDNFQSDFINYITSSSLSLNQIEIEITETCLIEDFEKVKNVLSSLRRMGIQIAIDDFGTGFASLNYLTQLEIDTIKIDRTFINLIDTKDKSNRIIVESIISMSHKLGYKVVAEGVETMAQLNILKELHCDFIQGYLLSKPLDHLAFNEFIQDFNIINEYC
ncbi:EAL domain-containing protein [Colwellia sp. 1_MG-2023]|uniref:EAL domain-containing protein n=1 Tax=unclassified Colwellia TaxID=196834 RepID=UPI001C095898|nr:MULTISPECIES: EAL domain-containing protein [unclassified Colwellia]MBU2923719.1 EAL domain-containing protein [Colwellia sp. C2M11]MDO6652181.1 EAL domain-containing protein [Colwellia sp. 3_MG-2023]MDO6664650.1 EAL domain-containing protein [Colwellia sp. 2_MG-2023]MDO6689001.1 EAL domain-containing protein [Colwellia sp. 1_MG-2023]